MSTAAPSLSAGNGKGLDVICLGRLGVDFYAQQLGTRLEEASTFAKYLGGSSANIAFGCARLGLRAAMASRVGDDHMGRFLIERLTAEGCDVSHVSFDRQRLTALAVLGIQDRDTFPLIFYRENCADMAVRDEDVAEEFLGGSRALVITGTHFSTEHTHRISTLALERARRHGVKTVLDVDYRPVLWGLTKPEEGAQRFIRSDRVTAHLQSILPDFDLVVGTDDEFHIAGGKDDLIESLRRVRALTSAVLVLKLGPAGCVVIEGAIPPRLEDALMIPGFKVKVMNLLGAGDAFMAGLMKGWLSNLGWNETGRLANACGALVVSRHACSASMPTPAELDYFMARPGLERPDLDPQLTRLHRVTPRRRQWAALYVFAFDHRSQSFELAQEEGAQESKINALKLLLVRAVEETEKALRLKGRIGALIDDAYGDDALLAASGRGWWLGRPVELPGSLPLEFEGGRSVGTRLVSWPHEHVVKCLVRFHPDEPVEERLEQETQLQALYGAVQASGHELILELILSSHLPQDSQTIVRALKRLYNIGIYPDWWKLEPMSAATWRMADQLVSERDPHCRGMVLLDQNATIEELAAAFREAAAVPSCRGFVVGRTISHLPSREWLAGRIDDTTLIAHVRANFEAVIRAWAEVRGSLGEAS